MAFKVILLDDNVDRVEQYVDIMTQGFCQPSNAANRAMMPSGRTPRNRAIVVENIRKGLVDPRAPGKLFQGLIVDEQTDEAVAMFNWKLSDREYQRMMEETSARATKMATVDCNEAAMLDFFGGLDEAEAEVMGKQEYWCLSILATSPAHERRGAGKLALEWGCQKADEAGLPAFVQATPAGAPLYARFGFKAVSELPFDCRKYGVDRDYVTLNMLRPAQRQEK